MNNFFGIDVSKEELFNFSHRMIMRDVKNGYPSMWSEHPISKGESLSAKKQLYKNLNKKYVEHIGFYILNQSAYYEFINCGRDLISNIRKLEKELDMKPNQKKIPGLMNLNEARNLLEDLAENDEDVSDIIPDNL